MNQKGRTTAINLLVILLCSMFVIYVAANRKSEQNVPVKETEPEVIELWYTNTLYEPYLEMAAEQFGKEENVSVKLTKMQSLDYIDRIEEANKKLEGPDVFLTDSSNLQSLVWMRAAEPVELIDGRKEAYVSGTWENLEYQGVCYGYPLGFDTTVLVHNDTFSVEPENLESLMAYVNKHSETAPEDILLWDDSQFLQTYTLFGNYAVAGGETGYGREVNLSGEEFLRTATLYQQLSNLFLGEDSPSYAEIKDQFASGNLQYALIHTDGIKSFQSLEFPHSYRLLWNWTKDLETKATSVTDIVMVNSKSNKKELAEQFADYLSEEFADKMYETCGILPLAEVEGLPEESEIFYLAYEESDPLPKLTALTDYWSRWNASVKNIRKGSNVAETMGSMEEVFVSKIEENK